MADHNGRLTAEILARDAACRALAEFGPTPLAGAAQHPVWAAAWFAESGRDSRLILVREQDRPAFALPLDIETLGPVRIAGYLSGSHANGNFPLLARGISVSPEKCARAALELLARGPERIDLLVLRRQHAVLDGIANPLLGSRTTASPDISLALRLDGGFASVLARRNGARRRKKHRWQQRQFESRGPVRYFRAETAEDVARCLEACLAMKEARFSGQGIRDPFAAPEIRRFFLRMFRDALAMPDPAYRLHGLEVGGILRAVAGTSRRGKRMICEFTGFAQDELAHASPGDFLFHGMIRFACEEGMEVFDFSTGDEPYKRQWCDLEARPCDSHFAFTAPGALLSAAMRMQTTIRRRVKSSPAAMRLFRRIRKVSARGAGGDE